MLVEAAKARALGKLFVAAILESLARTLPQAPVLAQRIAAWPGDPASAGVTFRLNAGLHALARSGTIPALHQIYRAATAATQPHPLLLDAAVMAALVQGEDDLLRWLAGPTQTNEVARVAGLAAVLMELSARDAMPCRLLELGASAGLNLNLARYDLHIGAARAGDAASAVHIAPRWEGRAPRAGAVDIAGAAGVDLSPLDVARQDHADRLHAYIWPGERARSQRLCAAIGVAQRHPPQVAQGRAAAWLAIRLAEPQAIGERRVVFHSMVLQYLPEGERRALGQVLAAAGAQATADRPLVRVGLEWNEARSVVELRVTEWDGRSGSGKARLAARCHPYAEWFEWLGLED